MMSAGKKDVGEKTLSNFMPYEAMQRDALVRLLLDVLVEGRVVGDESAALPYGYGLVGKEAERGAQRRRSTRTRRP